MNMEYGKVNPTNQNVVPSDVNHVNLICFESSENRINPPRIVTQFYIKVSKTATVYYSDEWETKYIYV
jgi:hypothetical protein